MRELRLQKCVVARLEHVILILTTVNQRRIHWRTPATISDRHNPPVGECVLSLYPHPPALEFFFVTAAWRTLKQWVAREGEESCDSHLAPAGMLYLHLRLLNPPKMYRTMWG
ncbi:hypothetical protein, unlikely [Trypanosoma brucei gambiense DAL972]|uniref:Uncharacterized protein n=1 Tax=Trypanosoma brucei gambiense (strain MHOM/CI/86/DAL972) TaxID=679716 RepID=D0A015_TRYB9|nr:hypothetical protein, unlikely [Trypanosoma brucei gambiense DAL972]CBH16573.1 hypothetical protein, unlikely [Trypanosoma brucei gambiense DAL972]|eukprot:XP_011778837.1 hypothetical protein, unlikely [Trypanosoma brucei gambiense DAL972]